MKMNPQYVALNRNLHIVDAENCTLQNNWKKLYILKITKNYIPDKEKERIKKVSLFPFLCIDNFFYC